MQQNYLVRFRERSDARWMRLCNTLWRTKFLGRPILHQSLFQTQRRLNNIQALFERRHMEKYSRTNALNFNTRHSIVLEMGRTSAYPPRCYIYITADQSWSRWLPVPTAEFCDAGIKADCTLSHWQKKPDVGGCYFGPVKRNWAKTASSCAKPVFYVTAFNLHFSITSSETLLYYWVIV